MGDEGSYSQAFSIGKSYATLINTQNKKASISEKKMMCQIYTENSSLNKYFKKEATNACILELRVK
jgi:hypothetical protein